MEEASKVQPGGRGFRGTGTHLGLSMGRGMGLGQKPCLTSLRALRVLPHAAQPRAQRGLLIDRGSLLNDLLLTHGPQCLSAGEESLPCLSVKV